MSSAFRAGKASAEQDWAVTIFDSVTPKTFEDIEILLEQLSPSDKFAVLSSDGYVTTEAKKVNAVSLEGHLLVHPRQSFCIVVPYEPHDDDHPFAFSKPKIASQDGFDIDSIDVGAAFSRGRDSHPQGAVLWRAHLRSG